MRPQKGAPEKPLYKEGSQVFYASIPDMADISSTKATKTAVGLKYLVSSTFSDHTVAFLRATPELTMLEHRNVEHPGFHDLLNLPAQLSREDERCVRR
jgi:hypothetical protein